MRRTCELSKLVTPGTDHDECLDWAVDFVTVKIEPGSDETIDVWLCARHYDRFMAIAAAMQRLKNERT